MEKISFKVCLWGFNVTFYNDIKRANKETGLDLDEISTFTYDDDNEVVIIINGCEYKNISNENLRYLVHETNHAAMRILERVGVAVDFDNQEALCYTQDYIFSQIIEGLDRLSGK